MKILCEYLIIIYGDSDQGAYDFLIKIHMKFKEAPLNNLPLKNKDK